MREREELELILKLIQKYNLPLSPILEYAVKEKMEDYSEDSVAIEDSKENETPIQSELPKQNDKTSLDHIVDKNDVVKVQFDNSEYRIENYTNQCFLINKLGKRVYSSSGKLIVLNGALFRVYYTYSSISLNIIQKDKDKERFRICERIIYARYRTPLHDSLDKKNYYDKINAIKNDSKTNNYFIKSGNKWYNNSGFYADFGQEKDADISRNDITIEKQPFKASNELRIVEYGQRSVAVIGETPPHKNFLRAMGGYFMVRSQWGPAWIFPQTKRERIQAYIDGDLSVVDSWEEKNNEESQKRSSSRYIIRVKYPNGSEFCSNLVWETLVDVVMYAGAERVKQLNIICMGDNLVSSHLNNNIIYRSAQKDIGRGLYVCSYSSTEVKYKQIERINQELHLGLKVEKVYVGEKGSDSSDSQRNSKDSNINNVHLFENTDDKRIGCTVRLYPSQLKGEIVRSRVDSKGRKKLIIRTSDGQLVEIDDLPYLYEVLSR